MKDLCRKFLRLLRVELEDLKEDLDLFMEVMSARHDSGEITDYVYNENLAVLRNEVMGLHDCMRGCADSESFGQGTVQEIADAFKERLHARLKEHGYVSALYSLVDRRIDRIAGYLKSEFPDSAAPPARVGGRAGVRG
ncbi:MAG TPA: hypothetical protein VMW69_12180 [Spirochaetia bacterium]|nr:hypothetical protein [Spirochaetia bacterium]